MPATPAPTQRRTAPADLIGRAADTFTAAELDALPSLTVFGSTTFADDPDEQERLGWMKTPAGWVSVVGRVDSGSIRCISRLVCIAVGEPDGANPWAARDGVHALTSLDRLLPRPTKPLHVIASETRSHRVSAADCEEIFELVYRLRKIATRNDCDLSITIGPDTAQVQFLRATPDLIGATKAPNSDHMHHIDAAGTLAIWRAQ